MLQYTFDISTFEYFLLILVRISCFVFVAPFFGAKEVPGRVKVGLSAFVAILVFFAVPMEHTAYTSEIGYAVLVLKEGITGLLIGFAAYICNSIILYAGTIIDMDIGLSMAMVFDPSTGSQVSITGNLYSYFVLLLLIVSNMHQYILRALVDSFSFISSWRSTVSDGFVVDIHDTVLYRFVCDRISYCAAGFCLHDDFELHFGYYGKGCTTDEHVCRWCAIKIIGRIGGVVPYDILIARDCQLYF